MNTDRRDSIRDSLRRLAEAHAATMEVMERTYELLCEELALDPQECLSRPAALDPPADHTHPVIDRSRFTVSFRGRTCCLGNTMPFRFLARLVEGLNCYVSHQDLFEDVWDGQRSADAVRSVVRTLRQKLRQEGLAELAAAIDGTQPGHYALRLSE
jgi:DNA-binding response OmpR family regulator